MARTGNNIYYRSDLKKWEGRYIKGRKSNGRLWYGYVSAKTEEECIIRRDRKAQEFKDAQKQAKMGDRLSFGKVAVKWLESVSRVKKDTTICKYRNNINLHLKPKFGNCRYTEIMREDVIDFICELKARGGSNGAGMSDNTIKGILSVLREILEYAELQYHFPAANLSKITIGTKEDRLLRILTENEEAMILDYVLAELDSAGLAILTVLYTGLRLGELCALHWEDINFSEGTIYVHTTIKRIQTPGNSDRKTKVVITTPKSRKSERTIPLHPDLIEILQANRGANGTVFLTGKKDIYVDPRTMENRFKKIVKEVGIADANFHSLRHTFATRSIENGIDAKVLSEILGHASVKLTLDRYVHPSDVQKKKSMVKLPGFKSRMQE